MSQSPDSTPDQTATDKLVAYRNAWTALSHLIGEGRSFSGHERNCCFLNVAGGSKTDKTFANISGVSGLDFDDDGRAVALSDWDFDGKLDLWVANRTAPRVRFLRNNSSTRNNWIAFRLTGTSSNRDAIGSKIDVATKNRNQSKTLRAGDGYLSQSSKTVHFGISSNSMIQDVVVRWPSGRRETFANLQPNQIYSIVEGSGSANRWTPPSDNQVIAPGPPMMPDDSVATRTWIQGRVPLINSETVKSNGEIGLVDEYFGQPLLVTLWSASCPNCRIELTEWTNQKHLFNEANLKVLALSVDEQNEAFVNSISFPFESGQATDGLVSGLDMLQQTFVELQTPLPIPYSLLLDEKGRLACIYQGSVSASQLTSDVRLLHATKEDQRSAAVPFAGRFASQVFPSDPFPVLKTIDLLNRTGDARRFLQRHVDSFESGAKKAISDDGRFAQAAWELGKRQLAAGHKQAAAETFARLLETSRNSMSIHRGMGTLLLQNSLPRQALPHLSIALNEKNITQQAKANLEYNIGLANMSIGEPSIAIAHFENAARLNDSDPATHFHFANALQATADFSNAAVHYRRALELKPNWIYPANNLAWILATSTNDSLRDGEEAIRLATVACEATKYQDMSALSTLAVAYAEANQFDKAMKANENAMRLAKGKTQMLSRLKSRQVMFQAGKPYRDKAE